MRAQRRGPSSPFSPVWGPSYDGTVVHSFRHRMRDYLERMARYDMIFGVATADALVFGLNDKELEYGIEMDGRNRILSDFVASNYKVQQTPKQVTLTQVKLVCYWSLKTGQRRLPYRAMR